MQSIVPGPAPDQQKSSKAKGVAATGGRKLVGGGSTTNPGKLSTMSVASANTQQPKEDRPRPSQHTTMEELDRMLEDDALGLMNMKKEMLQSQQVELAKSRRLLDDLKKEYNNLKIHNDTKEKETNKLRDKITEFKGIRQASEISGNQSNDVIASIMKQIAEVNENIDAEQRTSTMLNLMIKRLEEEIKQCRIETSQLSITLEHTHQEYASLESSLVLSRHENAELEKKLEKMANTIRSRRQEREVKMGTLNSIVAEGQNSLARVQSEAFNASQFGGATPKSKSSPRDRSPTQLANAGKQSPLRVGSRGTPLSMEAEDFGVILSTLNSDDPEAIARLSIDEIQSIADRYRNRESKLEKMEQLDGELKSNIAVQKAKMEEIKDSLNRAATKYQQIASSRQIYQEVDMKDAALAAARKECESCKEREYRLRQHIESLRRSIPRFLTKLTKVHHPVPTVEQLSDAVQKLEDEVSKTVKVITSNVMKDATPEDIANLAHHGGQGSGSGGDNSSELARLQKMPGFARLQRHLYFNLMTSQPDVSMYNIRILTENMKKQGDVDINVNGGGLGGGNGLNSNGNNNNNNALGLIGDKRRNAGNNNRASASSLGTDEDDLMQALAGNAVPANQIQFNQMTLDRDTVKNISKLIVDRDTVKANKTANAKNNAAKKKAV